MSSPGEVYGCEVDEILDGKTRLGIIPIDPRAWEGAIWMNEPGNSESVGPWMRYIQSQIDAGCKPLNGDKYVLPIESGNELFYGVLLQSPFKVNTLVLCGGCTDCSSGGKKARDRAEAYLAKIGLSPEDNTASELLKYLGPQLDAKNNERDLEILNALSYRPSNR